MNHDRRIASHHDGSPHDGSPRDGGDIDRLLDLRLLADARIVPSATLRGGQCVICVSPETYALLARPERRS